MMYERHRCDVPEPTLAQGMRWRCPECAQMWRLSRPGDPPVKRETFVEPLDREPGVWVHEFS